MQIVPRRPSCLLFGIWIYWGGSKKKHVDVGVKIDWYWQWWQVLRVGHVLYTHAGLLPLWLPWPQCCFASVWMPGFILASTHCHCCKLSPCVNSHVSSQDGELKSGELTRLKLCQPYQPVSVGSGSGTWDCLTLHPEGSAAVLGHFFSKVLGKDTPSCMWSQLLCISFLPWHTTHTWFSRGL